MTKRTHVEAILLHNGCVDCHFLSAFSICLANNREYCEIALTYFPLKLHNSIRQTVGKASGLKK